MFAVLEKERLKLYLGRKFVHWGNRMFPLVGHGEEFWSDAVFDSSRNKEDISLLHKYRETIRYFLCLWKLSTFVT